MSEVVLLASRMAIQPFDSLTALGGVEGLDCSLVPPTKAAVFLREA